MAVPPLYYVTVAMLKERMGEEIVTAFFDDNNDGSPDASPMRRYLLDAVSYVETYVRAAGYDLEDARSKDPAPGPIVDAVLDRAEAKIYQRHPEIQRLDVEKALDRVDKELLRIQTKQRRLDVNVLTDKKPETVGGALGRIGIRAQTPEPLFSDLGDIPGSSNYG